jgi:GT2 family glycosyltransferase
LTGTLSASVVVCTADLEREGLLRECLDSLLAGSRTPDEILLVVDDNPQLASELAGSLPPIVRLLQSAQHGLSEARNVGIGEASCDVVAFVDDDVIVENGWLACLMDDFEGRDEILGIGGSAVPRWGAERRWLSDELLWLVGCTYQGHREEAGPIRNPLGCNMAFRRRELVALGGFATQFGKRGNALETCDETELSLRLERAHGSGRIRYVPDARVRQRAASTGCTTSPRSPRSAATRAASSRSRCRGCSSAESERAIATPFWGPSRSSPRSSSPASRSESG